MTTQSTEIEATTPIADAVERDLAEPFTITVINERTWTSCSCGSLASHPLDGRGPANLTTWQDRHRSCSPATTGGAS